MSNLSVEFLQGMRERFGLKCFVETGCFRGDGIAAALAAGYEEVRSCDLSSEAINLCLARFSVNEAVRLFEGDSVSALRSQLADDLPPSLFWLDAHFPAYYGQQESMETKLPVFAEMALIYAFRNGGHSDVIVIDDIRVYHSPDNPRWNAAEVPEYFRIENISVTALTVLFRESHNAVLDFGQEGLLIMTPKSQY